MSRKKKAILVLADRDKQFVQNFSEYLSGLDIQIRSYHTGEQVIQDLKKKDCPFLYIINTNLGDIDGFSAIDCIRKSHCKDSAVVALLDTLNSKAQQKAVERHVLCSISVPVNFPELKSLVIKTYEQHLEKSF